MKLLLFIFCFFFSINVFSEEIIIYSSIIHEENSYFNNLSEVSYQVKYDTDKGIYYLYLKNNSGSIWVDLPKTDVNTLILSIRKSFKWQEIAANFKTLVNKKIPDSDISANITYKTNNQEWYYGKVSLYASHETTKEYNQIFRLYVDKPNILENKGFAPSGFVLFFNKLDLDKFLEGISPKALNNALAEYEKKKQVDSLFN